MDGIAKVGKFQTARGIERIDGVDEAIHSDLHHVFEQIAALHETPRQIGNHVAMHQDQAIAKLRVAGLLPLREHDVEIEISSE
jgi:hypothetical protein